MATAIRARYARAVFSQNLTVIDGRTLDDCPIGDPEVLGAMGLADKWLTRGSDPDGKPFKPKPLAVPLERLFMGDNRAVREIVRILSQMAYDQSRELSNSISRTQADDIAMACLAWSRHGTCKPCGGHGKTLISGTKTLSDHDCQPCKGTGRLLLEDQFKHRREWVPLVRWLVVQMEEASSIAGRKAMKALAGRMDL